MNEGYTKDTMKEMLQNLTVGTRCRQPYALMCVIYPFIKHRRQSQPPIDNSPEASTSKGAGTSAMYDKVLL